MEKSQAARIIRETFENSFDNKSFSNFTGNLFKKYPSDSPSIYHENCLPEVYKQHIYQLLRIFEYEDKDSKKIEVLIIQLKKETSLKRARTMQRNFIAWYLSRSRKDAALVAFISPEPENWRFSLVKMDYKIDVSENSIKLIKDLTPARRFSFLVGINENSHTIKSRLVNIVIDDKNPPTLKDLEEAFSVEKVTKAFYTDISYWYFWALKNVSFPSDAEKEENGRNIAVIRLITRLIFIWFMKERGLISKFLFNSEVISTYLKDLSPQETTYYKAILQNLFFATLNTRIKKRTFRFKQSFQGKNKDYMNHGIYRYEEYFKNKEDMLEIFKDIPFLNGGLFDCLDQRITENEKNIEIRIDGFTDKEVGLKVPNFLFFSEEKDVDLNEFYGTLNKKYKVRGLIDTLSSYNFTIDENEPNDQDVALDPELLGKVFENLLASFNPETATTARKATGSYYTPREIVNYMVTQTLKEYFKTHLNNIDDLESKLEELFLTNNYENPFNESETSEIVKLIDNLRIVDPAVGSGAFPMSILNKLVFLLSKLDPDNYLWKNEQIKAVDTSVSDPILKQKLIKQIEDCFNKKTLDYGRKLYLIQKCIYGVDIQQIAVEIAKLRFFISLLVDEKIDDLVDEKIDDELKENRGIEPLPNLDFKLMQGNSLISEFMGINFDLESINDAKVFDFEDELDILIKEFQSEKEKFQREPDKKVNDNLRKQIDDLIIKIFKIKLEKQIPQLKAIEDKYSLINDKMQKEEQIKREKEAYYKEIGFDIVIANPPYIDSESMVKIGQEDIRKVIQKSYKWTKGNWDIYIAFFELGFNELNQTGVLSFITPDKWISKPFGNELRKETINNIFVLLRAGRKVFESSKVDSIISFFSKQKNARLKVIDFINNNFILIREIDKKSLSPPFALDYLFSDNFDLLLKIGELKNRLSDLSECKNACATSDAYKLESFIFDLKGSLFNSEKHLKIINTGTINKYCSRWGKREMTYLNHKYLFPVVDKKEFLSTFKNSYGDKSVQPKIIIKGLNLLDGCLDGEGFTIPGKTTLIIANNDIKKLKFLLAIINSKLSFFYIKERYPASSYNKGTSFTKEMINNLPIPKINDFDRKGILGLVDKILEITISSDYLANPEKQAQVHEYKMQIDQLVYQLYGLTEDEIKIIEG